MPNQLQLILFGSPEVRLRDQPVTGFRTSKAQALLYYLAVTGRPHTRATLAGLLWGDQPEDAARASLSKCLSNLRDLLGDAMLIERQTVAFNRDYPYDLDTERFAAAVGQPLTAATSSALQAALTLYRGDLLEGFYVREAPDFEQWLLVQRAHYREAAINGLLALAGFYEQGGDLPNAITYTRRLLALEPWREEAHRQLMTWLARNGQRAAALAQFESCHQTLAEELAVEPDAETVTLVEAIRADKVTNWRNDKIAVAPPQPVMPSPSYPLINNLPIPATPLIGRERELVEVGELVGNLQGQLITITGPGGMGKTRLALAVAESQLAAQRFRNGVCFVSLAAVDDVQAILPTLMNALALSPESGQSSIEAHKHRLLTFLANKQMLLLFDNFEQILEGRTFLNEILIAAPSVRLLVTARERLRLQNEQVYPIGGLECPLTAADQDAPAVSLFMRTAQRVYPYYQPNEQERVELVRICQLVAGMPLALELSAGWMHLLTPAVIANALQTSLDLLESSLNDMPVRHRSMRATFDATWQLLTEDERWLFAKLSVFRGGFTRTSAQQVAGATLKQLSTLVDKSLIEYHRAVDRYTIHELLRQYAHEQLASFGQRASTQQRHAEYFLSVAIEAEAEMRGPRLKLWLDHLEAEYNNIHATLTWALEIDDITIGLKICGALRRFWHFHGHVLEEKKWFDRFLVGGANTPFAVQAKAYITAGIMEVLFLGQSSIAQTLLKQSLDLYQQLGDKSGTALAFMELGRVEAIIGNHKQALHFAQQSLNLYCELGDRWGIAAVHSRLGAIALTHGDYIQANDHLKAGLSLQRKAGDIIELTETLTTLAYVAFAQQDYNSATAYYTEVLEQWRNIEDKLGVAYTLNDLGMVALYQGKLEQAIIYLTEGFYLAQRLEYPVLTCITLANQGMVALEQRDYKQATDYYVQSLELSYRISNKSDVAMCLERLASVTNAQKNTERAIIFLSAASELRKVIEAPLPNVDRPRYDQIIESARSQLDETIFAAAWKKGGSMTLDEAVVYASGKALLAQAVDYDFTR